MQQASRNIFKKINEMILLFLKKCCKRKKKFLNNLLRNNVGNKVEYSRVNIFYKGKRFFFTNLHWNIKLIFSNL